MKSWLTTSRNRWRLRLDKTERVHAAADAAGKPGRRMKQSIRDSSMIQRADKRDSRTAQRVSLPDALPVCAAMLLALPAAMPCDGQTVSAQSHIILAPQPVGERVDGFSDLSGAPSPGDEKLLRALNAARQKSLVSDTNKLLWLVNELNAEIARADTGSLTPDQLRRVTEIEKLAHNVKEKMSLSVRGMPAFQVPFQPLHY